MDTYERYWVAGLLEGEGSFIRTEKKNPTINCTMTDEDVIRRLHQITGKGHVTLNRKMPNRKQAYTWRVSQREDAIELARELLPLMGERRQAAIRAMIEWHEQNPRQRAFKGRVPHGLRTKYASGCRCEPCRAAEANYQKDLRERRRNNEVGTKGVARVPYLDRIQED